MLVAQRVSEFFPGKIRITPLLLLEPAPCPQLLALLRHTLVLQRASHNRNDKDNLKTRKILWLDGEGAAVLLLLLMLARRMRQVLLFLRPLCRLEMLGWVITTELGVGNQTGALRLMSLLTPRLRDRSLPVAINDTDDGNKSFQE